MGTQDRRRLPRGVPGTEPARRELVALILSTYRDLPGLTLPLDEAARLFGIRVATCRAVLANLVDEGYLAITEEGQFRAVPAVSPSAKRTGR